MTPARWRLVIALPVVFLLALLVALLVGCGSRWDVVQPAIDGYRAPRAVHHAQRAATGLGTYQGLRAVRVPPRWALLGACALSPSLHAVGVARGAYRFDALDWLGDGVTTCGAALVRTRCARQVTRARCARWSLGYAGAYGLSIPGMHP
jgi:hypothetical protein